ncbi:50S ribosomal protein L31 [Pseudomonas sp. H9]|uniref:50S ribosomal protein L31 n=1 Tax=unclassified Pseudomonas TaxID=196821 RepID=UPI0010580E39|nr:50S ribosomal protein L31 [Pseudomonas sp. H9]TDF84976.1 50S ribosomal protein L31 [Pseudomonas sp. H9]
MKPEIHPGYEVVEVTCSCGNKFETRSTLCKALPVDVCNLCHPFYTGKQKVLDTGGRVQKFADRFGMFGAKK